MSPTTLAGLLLGVTFGGSLVLLAAAWRGWTPKPRGRSRLLSGASPASRKRAAWAAVLAVAVALVSRWPVAAVAAGALVYLWPSMFGGARVTAGHLARLEALATWTESLRDSIAGSIGLEEAIRHSVATAPAALSRELERLDGRLRVQVPLREALADFAADLKDASADLVIAALIMNSTLRGPGLVEVLGQLAVASREEIDMRRKVEVESKSLRRTAMTVVWVLIVLGGALTVFSRAYVAPYGTVLGQTVLLLVLAIVASGLMWIRSAATIRTPERFLVASDQVERAVRSGQWAV